MSELNIARPPWTKLGKQLESCVRKALYDFKMLEECPHLAVALSGGKDSLALLFLLHAISRGGFAPFKLTAIHVSGAFSCGANLDNTLLRPICNALEVPFIQCHAEQNLNTLECYSCSRRRRTLLFEAAKKEGITTIAFGHHKDDSTQTLLMNLFHKGEFATMLPKLEMVDYGVSIIRPLIYVREKDIISFAQLYGFRRITCQCPIGQRSMRKKTEQLISELEEHFPNIRENVASAALLYGSDKSKKQIN
jgi:tRNA(Ile)-lysidine synthase TilS/MesJ